MIFESENKSRIALKLEAHSKTGTSPTPRDSTFWVPLSLLHNKEGKFNVLWVRARVLAFWVRDERLWKFWRLVLIVDVFGYQSPNFIMAPILSPKPCLCQFIKTHKHFAHYSIPSDIFWSQYLKDRGAYAYARVPLSLIALTTYSSYLIIIALCWNSPSYMGREQIP